MSRIIFQRDALTGEIDSSYNGRTGERVELRLRLIHTGPRGGRREVWSGTPFAARRMRDDLAELIAASREVPESVTPLKEVK